MKKTSLFLLLLLLTAVLTSACSTAGRIYPEEDPALGWYPAKIENELAGTDPIEPFNRTMFTVNDFLMEWIADPVARVYGSIMPRPGVEAIERVCLNLEFPARLISTLGSAEWKGALDETCRFLLNSTIGIAGLFDPAEYFFHIHSTDSDFGQMFAVWGIGPGCTFILPFCPGTNVRDTVGFLFDYAFDIKSYLPYTYLATLNRFVVRQQAYAPIVKNSADRYKTYRFMLALYREMQLKRYLYAKKNQLTEAKKMLLDEDGNLLDDPPLPVTFPSPAEKPEGLLGNWISQPEYFSQGSGELDSIRGIFTAPEQSNDYWWLPHTLWGSNFYRKIDIRKMENGGRYAIFRQPDPEEKEMPKNDKLLIFIPGIEGTYDGTSTLMAAETFYNKGYDVIAIDSVFFWRGMTEGAGKNNLPGYVPQDAERIRTYLAEVLADVKREDGRKYKDAILAGWSYGALCTAHIMQSEAKEKTLPVARAVLINPPADLDYAMNVIDGYVRNTAKWSKEEMREILTDTVGSGLVSASVHMPAIPENATAKEDEIKMAFVLPDIREDAAGAAAGIMLRNGIRDILFTQHLQGNMPLIRNNTDWGNRNSLYDELERIEFKEYARKFLMPAVKDSGVNTAYGKLAKQSSLYSLMPFLKQAENITLLHTWNDILTSDADRKALDQTFGKRGYWFDAGGHLGNLHTERFRKTFLKAAGAE